MFAYSSRDFLRSHSLVFYLYSAGSIPASNVYVQGVLVPFVHRAFALVLFVDRQCLFLGLCRLGT